MKYITIVVVFLLAVPPAPACSICSGNLGDLRTFRQDAANSKLILYGTLENPQVKGDSGTTDFRITTVLLADPFLGDRKVIQLPRYIPVDKKEPPHYLLFCDIYKNQLDPFRGTPVKSAAAADYVKGALAIDAKDRIALLRHCFDYLEHPDKEIAFDAYLEFAKATDQEIGQVAGKLAPEKLRGWIKDAQTPPERVSLYAFLLGSCGGDADAELLRAIIDKPTEKTTPILDGILDGYIRLRPREGWDTALKLLGDPKQPFPVRFALVRTLRFYHNWKPEDTREQVLRGLRSILEQGDLADLAIGDLVRWQTWDLTKEVLALYGKKSHDAPIVRRAILRYALSCPKDEAAAFVAERRRQEPDLVKEVADGLQFEKR
jgi:hypothetical protein